MGCSASSSVVEPQEGWTNQLNNNKPQPSPPSLQPTPQGTGQDPLSAESAGKIDTKYIQNGEAMPPPKSNTFSKTENGGMLAKEENLDLDLDDPELNQAAVKIQSSYRGFHTRKEMHKPSKDEADYGVVDKAKMSSDIPPEGGSTAPTTEGGAKLAKEENLDLDLDDPELNQAAVKIQSSYRGFHTRKEMHKPNKDEADYWVADKAKMSSDVPPQGPTVSTVEVETGTMEDLQNFANIRDEEELNKLNNAATAIQSGFKGYQTRKSLKKKNSKTDLSQEEPKAVEDTVKKSNTEHEETVSEKASISPPIIIEEGLHSTESQHSP